MSLLEMLESGLDEGRSITASTHNSSRVDPGFVLEWETKGVYFNHAYSLKSVDVQGGKITLDNPHGPHTKDIVIDVEDFQKVYSTFSMETH